MLAQALYRTRLASVKVVTLWLVTVATRVELMPEPGVVERKIA